MLVGVCSYVIVRAFTLESVARAGLGRGTPCGRLLLRLHLYLMLVLFCLCLCLFMQGATTSNATETSIGYSGMTVRD